MIIYLQNWGGALDFADTKTLLTEREQEWDASEVPTMYCTSTELKKQCNNSPEPESRQT
jgi:hypothetical protein